MDRREQWEMVRVISIPSARLRKHYGSKVQFSRRRKRFVRKSERQEKVNERVKEKTEEGLKKCFF